MLKINDSKITQLKVEEKLFAFMDFLHHLICKRCWREEHKLRQPFHHDGGFLYLLGQKPKITKSHFQKWVDELEHGFLHGFVVAFFYYSLSEDPQKFHNGICKDGSLFSQNNHTAVLENYSTKELHVEKIFYSCLFHDYVKVVYGQEPHDKLLERFFPLCCQEAYSHKEPTEDNNFVLSDRMELLRYSDHQIWCDQSLFQTGICKFGELEYYHFFKTVRPCLEEIIKYQKDVWISHVSESKETHETFYPSHRWFAHDGELDVEPDTGHYISVNTSYLPLSGNCHAHTYESTKNQNLPCLTGLISKTKLFSLGNEITYAPNSTWGRDHPFLKENKKIPIQDWIFVYNDINDLNYIKGDVKVISHKTFNKFIEIKDKILSKIEVLKVE